MLTEKKLHKIIDSCLNKDSKGEYELYEYCFPIFFIVCRRYTDCDEHAREALNLAFHKVLINLEKFDKSKSFNAWVSRIMVTTSIDEYRKKRRRAYIPLSEVVNFQLHKNEIEDSINEQNILNYLDYLPPMGKKVFNLFAIDGYKHKEIAEMLSISENTSKWHVSESRKKLQKMLKKNEVLNLSTIL